MIEEPVFDWVDKYRAAMLQTDPNLPKGQLRKLRLAVARQWRRLVAASRRLGRASKSKHRLTRSGGIAPVSAIFAARR